MALGQLTNYVTAFAALLHATGVAVGPGQVLTGLDALSQVTITEREQFRAALRCTLVRRHEDLAMFELAFALFWQAGTNAPLAPDQLEQALPLIAARQRQLRLPHRPAETDAPSPPESEAHQPELRLAFSYDEVLRQKDFAQCSWEELAACKELIRRMPWQVTTRPSRRQQVAPRGRQLDLRRTLRAARRTGGEPLRLARRQPRPVRRPVVLICDISGSMERYARLLIQFAHALRAGLGQVESFVFGTRLTRITRQLRHADLDAALDAVSQQVCDWSGGTRIGAAIKQFNYAWGRRVLGSGPVVLLISDGWDRGEPELLAREMDRLQRSCHRLIWLNPLLGRPGYAPLTVGLQAALPFVDDFLPVHNLASLEQLGQHLAQLPTDRPKRRQIGNTGRKA
ncbi:MAG: vWA domain-containing protein [Oscillochloridaceae bacterium umkhey_bin13]